MAIRVPKEHSMDLYKAILTLKTEEECFQFFTDICAVTELFALEQRFDVARMLSEGAVYTDIAARTRASSATISRVNRMLNYGAGGINEVLRRMQENNKEDET